MCMSISATGKSIFTGAFFGSIVTSAGRPFVPVLESRLVTWVLAPPPTPSSALSGGGSTTVCRRFAAVPTAAEAPSRVDQ